MSCSVRFSKISVKQIGTYRTIYFRRDVNKTGEH
jgi:hypothetical protein